MPTPTIPGFQVSSRELKPSTWKLTNKRDYSSGTSISPFLTASVTSRGCLPSMVQPTDMHVPRISLTVPLSVRAWDLARMILAMLTISSNAMLPLCLTDGSRKSVTCVETEAEYKFLLFFCFFLSRGGSLSALITKEEADGTTEMAAWRFWMVNWTVIFRPFQSWVALAISSPTFLGDYTRHREM